MNKLDNVSRSKIFTITLSIILAALVLVGFSACAPSEYEKELRAPILKTPDILENGYLKVGVDFGNPPLAGETSKSAGIDIDVAYALGEQLGLKVEFVDVGASPELALANKKVDLVMGVSKSTNAENMWKSDVYIQTASAIFAKDANTALPTKDSGQKISSQMGSASAIAAQSQLGADSVKFENSISKCFESLDSGEVRYVAGDAVIGAYNVKSSEIRAEIISLLSKPSGYCIACNSESTALIEKLTAALDTIKKGGITSVIEKKWLGRALNLDEVQLMPEASNQVDAGELDAGVYSQTGSVVSGDSKSL